MPFKITGVLIVLTGIAFHFWSTWYVPLIIAVFIIVCSEYKVAVHYLGMLAIRAVLMICSVWGYYQAPFGEVASQETASQVAFAFLTFFYFGMIIADYFNLNYEGIDAA